MLSNTDVKNTYSGNGSTIYWSYTFTLPIISTGTEIEVYITDSDGTTGSKLTSGYTVDIDNKRVIYPDPYVEDDVLPSGYEITLIRETPKTQLSTFSGQNFNPKSFENTCDKTVMMVQELANKVSRAVIANITSDVNYALPEAEAEKVLGWNTAGDGLINYDNPAAAEEQAIASAAAAATSQTAAANSATSAANQVTLAANQVTLATAQATAAASSAAEAKTASNIWKASTNITTVGQICYLLAYPYIMLECVATGITGTSEPFSFTVGSLLTDNTVTWYVTTINTKKENSIINGSGIVQQRAAATISATAKYGIDMWAAYASGTAISAGTFGQSTSCPIGRSGYGIALTGATITGTGIIYKRYRMEAKDAARFVNQSATFSCLVYHDVGSAINYTITVNKPTSTADNFSSVTAIGNQATSVVTATSTKLIFNIANMGACGNGIEILISIACGAITTKNFYLTEAQFVLGTVLPDFEYRLFRDELNLCKRYFEKSYDYEIVPGTALSVTAGYGSAIHVAINSADFYDLGMTEFEVAKRATPAMAEYNTYTGTASQFRGMVDDSNNAIAAFRFISTTNFCLYASSANMTVGYDYSAQWTADAAIY